MALQSATPSKTREDVESLMQVWRNDPCFDLEDTEGFEEYRDELLAYSNQVTAEWKQKVEARIAVLSKRKSAGEIRYDLSGADTNCVLVEIAAQLAEANELKRFENAADDMLAVLKAAIAFIGQTQEYKTGHTGAGSIVNRGNAAIAKAGGQ